jgi:hypothetical protein
MIILGLHKDAAVRAEKSKDATAMVCQEMADIVSALRTDCQSLRVQRAEAEWQATHWHTFEKVCVCVYVDWHIFAKVLSVEPIGFKYTRL